MRGANEVSVIDDKTTAALETMDSGSREIAITEMLERAQSYLEVAMQQPDAPRAVADFKAEIIAVAQYAKQKRVSEEIQIDATVMVRRAERSLGVAIREGQGRGTVQTISTAARDRELMKAGVLQEKSCSSPSDFATPTELYGGRNPGGGVLGMTDDVTGPEFDAALDTAKGERNLSRANVVRKIKEAKGEIEPQEMRPRRPIKLNTAKTMERLTSSLWGVRQSLQTITAVDAELNQDQVAAWIKELSQTSAELNRIKNLLKESK